MSEGVTRQEIELEIVLRLRLATLEMDRNQNYGRVENELQECLDLIKTARTK